MFISLRNFPCDFGLTRIIRQAVIGGDGVGNPCNFLMRVHNWTGDSLLVGMGSEILEFFFVDV